MRNKGHPQREQDPMRIPVKTGMLEKRLQLFRAEMALGVVEVVGKWHMDQVLPRLEALELAAKPFYKKLWILWTRTKVWAWLKQFTEPVWSRFHIIKEEPEEDIDLESVEENGEPK